MAEKPRLSPQSVGSGRAGSVPVIREASIPSLRNIPNVGTSGIDAMTKSFEKEAIYYNQMSERVNSTIGSIIRQREINELNELKKSEKEAQLQQREIEAQQKLAELDPTSLMVGSVAEVELSLANGLDRIVTQTGGDPETTNELYGTYVDELTKDLDPETGNTLRASAVSKAAPVLKRLTVDDVKDQINNADNTIDAALISIESEALESSSMEDKEETTSFMSAISKYNNLIDSAPKYTPSEKAFYKARFAQNIQKKVVLDDIANSNTPLLDALNNDMPDFVRRDAIRAASEFKNIRNQIENERNTAKAKQRASNRLSLRKQAVEQNDIATANMLMEQAETSDEYSQAFKLMNDISDRTQEAYGIDDPIAVRTLTNLIYNPYTITPDGKEEYRTKEDLTRLVLDSYGDGLSTGTMDKLLSRIDNIDEEMMNSAAMASIKAKAKTIFPKVYRTVSSSGSLVMLRSASPGDNLSDEETLQMDANDMFFSNLNREIASGNITSERQLLQEADIMLMAEQDAILKRGSVVVDRVVRINDLDTTLLDSDLRNNFERIKSSNVAAVVKAQQDYLKDPSAWVRDRENLMNSDVNLAKDIDVIMNVYRINKEQ